jgi:hypothetical protein
LQKVIFHLAKGQLCCKLQPQLLRQCKKISSSAKIYFEVWSEKHHVSLQYILAQRVIVAGKTCDNAGFA